jgi:hypothetical protein
MSLAEFPATDYLLSWQVLSQTELPAYLMQPSSYQIGTATHGTALTSILGPFGPRTHFCKQLEPRVEHFSRESLRKAVEPSVWSRMVNTRLAGRFLGSDPTAAVGTSKMGTCEASLSGSRA